MNEIIPVSVEKIGDQTIQTVNARALHTFLDVGKVFAAWIQERIEKFDFVENQDFAVFSEFGNNPNGGRPAKEYAISLDMAKELAMVENNERGRQVRRYFIAVEKQFKAQAIPDLSDPAALRNALLAYTERVIALENTVKEQAPKVLAFDRLDDAAGSMCITDAAKTLKIGPKQLFTTLDRMGWIYRRGRDWVGDQKQLDCGRLEHKIVTFWTEKTGTKIKTHVRVTAKGLQYLAKKIAENAGT